MPHTPWTNFIKRCCIVVCRRNDLSENKLIVIPGCVLLFTVDKIGHRDNGEVLKMLEQSIREESYPLMEVVLIKSPRSEHQTKFRLFQQVLQAGQELHQDKLDEARTKVDTHDVCNLQFTSGTTGLPKAAMLSHQ